MISSPNDIPPYNSPIPRQPHIKFNGRMLLEKKLTNNNDI